MKWLFKKIFGGIHWRHQWRTTMNKQGKFSHRIHHQSNYEFGDRQGVAVVRQCVKCRKKEAWVDFGTYKRMVSSEWLEGLFQ